MLCNHAPRIEFVRMESFLKKFRLQICAAVAAVAVLIGGGEASSQTSQVKPYRIGSFLAVTWPGAFLGAPSLATLRLYVDLLYAQGGELGRRRSTAATRIFIK